MNLWLDMDKITNVYIESVKYSVLQRHSKECDPKLVDATVKKKWNWNWLTETDFSKHSDFLSDYIVKINKPGQAYCFYCSVPEVYRSLENEVCESMQNEISFTSNSKNKYSYISVLSRTQWKKRDHMKHVLYLMVLLLIFTKRNSALLEKLYRKNLQSS